MRLANLALVWCLLGAACEQAQKAVVCNQNQILGTDKNGQLVCVIAPGGDINPPHCDTGLTSNGQQISCTILNTAPDKDQDVGAALQQLDDAVKNFNGLLQAAPPMASFVGVTANVAAGDFFANGGATLLCARQFGVGSHLCTMDELYQAVVNGTLGASSTIKPAWVYMPNWNTPVPNANEPLQGVADTCDGYSYMQRTESWRGILVEWSPLPDGTPGFRWHGGQDAYCDSNHPITCCK